MNEACASRPYQLYLALLSLIVMPLLFSSCSNVNASLANVTPTVTIAANPSSITAGAASTLTVAASNATSVKVTGSDGSSYTLQPTGGTQSVSPSATTSYTVTATGSGGNATASATVTVSAAVPSTPTVTITANPTSIASGASSTLTVTATNATSVTISGSDGTSYTLQPTGGTQTVSPSATTSYTATATGAGGQALANTTVTVAATTAPAPTVSITANPASIAAGASSTLTVTAANATSVTIAGSDGSSYTLQPAGGTQSVTPSATATYTVTATGAGGKATATATVTVSAVTPPPPPAPTVTITASPATIMVGGSATLTVTASNASQVTVTGTDGSSYTLQQNGGTQTVSPNATTTYTATATGTGTTNTATGTAVVTVIPPGSVQSVQHVVFMLQENHSFDNYFGMLNPYRQANGYNIGDDGKDYEVDGIDDKLTTISNQDQQGDTFHPFKLASTCIDDVSSDWLASFGDVSPWDFSAARPINMDGFVHNAQGYEAYCKSVQCPNGSFNDDYAGQRAMGYYDQDTLNYYYYMASQFAVSDRWFSPVASKSVPNRIATFTGGTTQGLVKDPGTNDNLPQLDINNIFEKLDQAHVSWKIYYTVTQGYCLSDDDCTNTSQPNPYYPDTVFSTLSYSYQYLRESTSCAPNQQPSSAVGDPTNSFCIDTSHIAPLSQYYTDLQQGTLPSFAFIEAGYGRNDEHPGSNNSLLPGQIQVSKVVNALMASSAWSNSVFFLSYDEAGGPYDHVPPVPGHSNDFTDTSLGTIPDIAQISVSPDSYIPCPAPGGTPTSHCDLIAGDPGYNSTDVAATKGFGAQIGFSVPNMVISPFTRKHYVSHIPMDHTAIIKFVEDRFIGDKNYLTSRDAAQPNLLDFFDFNNTPWATPPTPPSPSPLSGTYDPLCQPQHFAPTSSSTSSQSVKRAAPSRQ